MNIIAWLEFELAYYDFVVHCFNHYTTRTLPLWSDESKFDVFWSNRRVYMQRKGGERAAATCITPTVKHGRGSVMTWGAFANCKVGDLHQVKGKFDQTSYHSIMRSHLEYSLWVKDLYSCKIMTQTILVNSARSTLKSKEEEHIHQLMSWPVQSVDLNPIELVLDELDQKVKS